ncbi:30S ribosomal protein S18 [Candidatus Karelsulcia muelleri]|uniref:30S ribosomal protein S18 n=1 Tax=Candidatus Karelsulcia muelleri TaxID=336810 RepID=UPI0035C90258
MKKNNIETETKIVKPKRSYKRKLKTEPEVAKLKPEVAKLKPEVAKLKPEVAKLKPEVAKLKPEVAKLKPEVAKLKPEVAKPKKYSIKKIKTAIFPIKNKILEYFNNEINQILKNKKIYFRLDEYKLLNNNIILNKNKNKKIIFNLKKKIKKKKIIKYKQNLEEIELRFLTPFEVKLKEKKKYCFFKKANIGYVDFKNKLFLIKFLNERAEILPRRITGTSKKFQRKIKIAVKRCKQIGLLPYITDLFRK